MPATLAARVRVLASGRSNKNDPNDALSVAVAALRSPGLAAVRRVDHTSVLRVLAKRHRELGSARTRTVCRLHAVIVDLVEGGIPNKLKASAAAALLGSFVPAGPVEDARRQVALEHLADLLRIDDQIKASRARILDAVAASGTTVVDIYGVGPVVAAMLVGYTGDVSRFATRDHYAAYNGTAPIEVSSGHPSAVAARQPPTQPRPPHRGGHPDPQRRHRRTPLL